MIRHISDKDARGEIADLVLRRPRLDYLEIAGALQLDLAITIKLVNEMVRGGSLLAVDDIEALQITGEW